MGRDYQAATVYFASGTGNSFRTAVWLADAARARGAEARVVPIDAAGAADELLASPEQLVGVSFPTHGLLPPWSMIKFLLRMRRRRGAHALVIATRGCAKLGPLYVPGVAGLATFLAGILLLAKGYRPGGDGTAYRGTTAAPTDTGIHPQLANPVSEEEARALLKDGRFCLQERSGATWTGA